MVMPLAYAFCNVPVMPLRSEPEHRSEQISQLLFGEPAEVIEVNARDWAYIQCTWDDYKGWCKLSQLAQVSKRDFMKPVKFLAASHTDKIIFKDAEMWLPMGSELRMKPGKLMPAAENGNFKGRKFRFPEGPFDCEILKTAANKYLHAPYQWGGRSILGIDCSGLTQMAFKFCNMPIPRDADKQAEEGELVDFLQHARCGDMAFFDNKDGKIVHVGILIDNQTIIHATDAAGRVVVDKIDQGGIISVALRKRTHNLRFVKRLAP